MEQSTNEILGETILVQKNDEGGLERPSEGVVQVEKVAGFLVFDREALRQNLMQEEDLILAVIESFLTHAPAQIQQLIEALEQDDREASERHAHSMKGASSGVGGSALSEVASQMELSARDGNLSAVKERVSEMTTQFELLKVLLERERAELVISVGEDSSS